MTTEPTDAEILAVIREVSQGSAMRREGGLSLRIARAVLAKWGTPPAVAESLEVTEAECEAAVLELEIADLHTPPQPTQAQAGAVPLTDEELYDEKRSAIPQLFDLAQQWADNKIHSYQFANEAEKIVNAVARRVEAAHGIGIKGGQHGAE